VAWISDKLENTLLFADSAITLFLGLLLFFPV
jgi:hypothetical protein